MPYSRRTFLVRITGRHLLPAMFAEEVRVARGALELPHENRATGVAIRSSRPAEERAGGLGPEGAELPRRERESGEPQCRIRGGERYRMRGSVRSARRSDPGKGSGRGGSLVRGSICGRTEFGQGAA